MTTTDKSRGQRLFDPLTHCRDCLLRLARNAGTLAGGDDPAFSEACASAAESVLETCRGAALTSPQMAHRILARIKRMSGIQDPFSGFKRKEMSHAREVLSRLEAFAESDLRSLVSLAALGNSVDFFKDPETALAELPSLFRNGVPFYRDDVGRLEACLATAPRKVLYFADNSGEAYFDLPLYEHIRQRSGRVVLVVKGGPALNDLTRGEIRDAGMGRHFEDVIDTGSDAPGVDWDLASDGLLRLVEDADLIISKGMANFETIHPRPLTGPVFYLFRVKCEPIGALLHAPKGSLMALWRNGTVTSAAGS